MMMGNKIFNDIINSIPFGIGFYLVAHMSTRFAFGYSNLPGPKKGLNFGGVKVKSFYGFAPVMGDATQALMAISMGKTIVFGFISDKGHIEDPDEFW